MKQIFSVLFSNMEESIAFLVGGITNDPKAT